MKRPSIAKRQYLDAAQLFHWASMYHFVMWFTGRQKRHRRTEMVLPELVRKKKLVAVHFGRPLVYCVPRRSRGKVLNIPHGLGCTEGLVRIWRARMDGEIIAERYLKGFGSVPEWGIRYPGRKILLYEYCTEDNFKRKLKYKLTKYESNLPAIEQKLDGEALVLIVSDVIRDEVFNFVKEKPTGEKFFFTDCETFKRIPIGEALKAPIYFWKNGKSYPLIS